MNNEPRDVFTKHDIKNSRWVLGLAIIIVLITFFLFTYDNKLRTTILNETVNISNQNYEGYKLEYDLNNDGEKEIIFQQNIGMANSIRLIIAESSGRVLFSTFIRAGKIEIKDNGVYHTSSIQNQESVTKISWNGNDWISEILK